MRLTAKDLADTDPAGLILRLENRLTGLEALETKTRHEIDRLGIEAARAREGDQQPATRSSPAAAAGRPPRGSRFRRVDGSRRRRSHMSSGPPVERKGGAHSVRLPGTGSPRKPKRTWAGLAGSDTGGWSALAVRSAGRPCAATMRFIARELALLSLARRMFGDVNPFCNISVRPSGYVRGVRSVAACGGRGGDRHGHRFRKGCRSCAGLSVVASRA